MKFQYNEAAIKKLSRKEFLDSSGDAFRRAGINPEEYYDNLVKNNEGKKKKPSK